MAKNPVKIITLDDDTQSIRIRLKNINESGKMAWEVGEICEKVISERKYRPSYPNFEEYADREFGTSANKIRVCIRIYENFSKEEASATLYSILEYLLDFKREVTSIVLFIYEKISNKLKKDKSELYLINMLLFYMIDNVNYTKTIEDIDIINLFLGLKKQAVLERKRTDANVFQEKINRCLQKYIELCNNYLSERNKSRGSNFVVKSHKIIEKENIHQRFITKSMKWFEPVNEMGVVCLFGCLFEFLEQTPFYTNYGIVQIEFLERIQSPFPDAILKMFCRESCVEFYLDVEIEYNSVNYIYHQHIAEHGNLPIQNSGTQNSGIHFMENTNMDLFSNSAEDVAPLVFINRKSRAEKEAAINKKSGNPLICLCWEHNPATRDKELGKLIPPIISLKEFLKTGEIEFF